MDELNKILEEIKEHQMQTVQLARTTEVYKLAEKAQKQALIIADVSGMLPADRGDAEEFLCSKKGICGHPHIQDSVTGKNDYEIADLMAEFANEYYGNYR